MIKVFFVLVTLSSLLTATPVFAEDESLTILYPARTTTYSLKEMTAKLKPVTVAIQDPVYKQRKVFDGFLLLDLLKLSGFNVLTDGDELAFTTLDGYSPHTSLEVVQKYQAILAFREHGKKGFEPIKKGRSFFSPGPYYLIWGKSKISEGALPWPYQLVKIESVNIDKKYSQIIPKNVKPDSSVSQGFQIFKNECLKCHSINLQGGNFGPELNIPQNVTEYWSKDTLRKFIKDPSSFRFQDKMPSFPQLKDQDIEAILDYLENMKSSKIIPEH